MEAEKRGKKKGTSSRKGRKKSGKRGAAGGAKRGGNYPFEFRLKAVKLKLEEGFTTDFVADELGISHSCLSRWIGLYRKLGEEGLKPAVRQKRSPKKSTPVKQKIVEVKKEHPRFGSRKISDVMRRFFFLKASPETVRKTLKEEGLIEKPKKKPERNPPKPRFFERSTPNQMWQSDIFTFRLGGRNAYLIGFMDDYSRFITGMDLFRSQTAENVIGVFRTAMAEYNPPKEMLTDNGRQYTNWRGTTKFEAELKKDRVHHFKSRPHHPMTLGKIERFWKTIFVDFLSRAQFDSFDSARSRIRLWIKYYNFKRPHQGIGGLCPADRYFEIQSQLKKTLEKGIAENVLEMALRGKPKSPFYMVGRMGSQSVVIRAEKGKVKMLVDGDEPARELEYPIMKEGGGRVGAQKESGEGNEAGAPERHGSDEGGAVGVGGAAQAVGGLPEPERAVDGASELGGPGASGYAEGASAAREEGPGAGALRPSAEAAGEGGREGGGPAKAPARPFDDIAGIEVWQGGEEGGGPSGAEERVIRDSKRRGEAAEPGAQESGDNPQGPLGPDDGQGGGEGARDLEEDVLRVGAAGSSGDAGGAVESAARPSGDPEGPGEGGAEAEGGGSGAEASAVGARGGDPEADGWAEGPGAGRSEKKRQAHLT
jgi:transposase InsO family protein